MGAASGSAISYTPFRPRHPIDPFPRSSTQAPKPSRTSGRKPWTVDAQTLRVPLLLHVERKVILTVGQPSSVALESLFESPQLASSLIIIACHKPPPIPSRARPAVHILRLRIPLVLEDAGASRLIDIFEWALQVARIWWRTEGPRVQELLEELSPVGNSVKLSSTYGRLSGSVAYEASSTSLPGAESRLKRRWTFKAFGRQSSQPEIPHRPFDAILNFLPSDVSEKAALKAAILVTTMSRPYMVHPPQPLAGISRSRVDEGPQQPPRPSIDLPRRTRRWSLFKGSKSAPNSSTSVNDVQRAHSRSQSTTTLANQSSEFAYPAPALVRARKARVLHVLPPTSQSLGVRSSQAQLVRSIETFLLSFCFAPSSTVNLTGLPRMDKSIDFEKARPYVLPARALGEVLHVDDDVDGFDESAEDGPRDWSLLDLVLAGILEGDDSSNTLSHSRTSKGKERGEGRNDWQSRRAWIGGVSDIVITQRPVSEHVVDEIMSPRPLPVRAPEEHRIAEPSRARDPVRSHSISHPLPLGGLVPMQHPRRLHVEPVQNHDSRSGARRYATPRPVERTEFNIDKRLPTPPQETPALVTPALRPGPIVASRPHRIVTPSGHLLIEPPVPRDHVRHSTGVDHNHLPQTPVPARRASKYHRKGASHDIPTPPDSAEGYIDTRPSIAPNIEDMYPPSRLYVPSVRRIDSSHATSYQPQVKSRRQSTNRATRPPRAVNEDTAFESADAYLAELDVLEQQRRRRRSRSQPQMVAQTPVAVSIAPGPYTAPMSQIALSPVPTPYHSSRRDHTAVGPAKGGRATVSTPRRWAGDDVAPIPGPVRIPGGNALGLRESPMVKANDLSHSRRSSRRTQRYS